MIKLENEVYTVHEVAELLHCADSTIKRRIKNGDLKAYKPKGLRKILIYREDLELYLNCGEIKTEEGIIFDEFEG